MTSDKICFICGTRHDIGKHHIIPKAIIGNRFVPNNTMPVCDHCHKGIHEGGRFLPNTKGWKNYDLKLVVPKKCTNWKRFKKK